MKLLATLSLVLTLLTLPGANAAADTYYVYDQWGGAWHDANKTWSDDNLMCWAAAASNILDWSDWGAAAYNTETSIFTYFKGYWTNEGSLPQFGWQWWLDGTVGPGVSGWATASGGGNFWRQVDFAGVFHTAWYPVGSPQTGNLMATVDSYFQSGYGVTLGIYKPKPGGGWYGHALTAWGFDYTGEGGNRTYTRVYVTDSDDGVSNLRNYLISWDAAHQWWRLDNYYGGGWFLADVEALDRNSVPIPTSLLLLGSGLLGLTVWRRKFRN